ncbi:hypothetical protein FEP76_02920 [Burkholderia multivorans]|nr:hypothetical protein [Burkholderia multivorans]
MPSAFCALTCAAKLAAIAPSFACAGSSVWLRNASRPPSVPPDSDVSGKYWFGPGGFAPAMPCDTTVSSLGSDGDVTVAS